MTGYVGKDYTDQARRTQARQAEFALAWPTIDWARSWKIGEC